MEENLEYGVELLEEAEAVLIKKFGEGFVNMNPHLIVQFTQTLALDRVNDAVTYLLPVQEEEDFEEESEAVD